jgi:hypothetical protein
MSPKYYLFYFIAFLFSISNLEGQTIELFDDFGPGVFVVPAGVTEITVECWGAGGAGATRTTNGFGGGGGGGAYSRSVLSVTSGQTFSYSVGKGGESNTTSVNGGNTVFGSALVEAKGGAGVNNNVATGGLGGQASGGSGDVRFSGGNGANGGFGSQSGGGGGGAGTTEDGGNAGSSSSGAAVAGIGGNDLGGNGGTGTGFQGFGQPGNSYGGGGSGGRRSSSGTQLGGNGADGAIRITYTLPIVPIFVQQSNANQVFFDNVIIQGDEPIFFVEAPSNGGPFNLVEIEVNTNANFTGTAYYQSFSGTFVNNQQDEFNCNDLSPNFSPSPMTVYYVRVRYSADVGVSWSNFSGTNSFTVSNDCDVDWYQWEEDQMLTGNQAPLLISQSIFGNQGAHSFQGYNSWGDYLVIQQIVVTTPGELQFLAAYVTGGSGGFGSAPCGNIRMGLYDASGNLLAQTDTETAVNWWNSLPTTTNPFLSAGTYYLGIMLSCNNMFIPMIAGSGSGYIGGNPFASGQPTNFSPSGLTTMSFDFLFHIGIDDVTNALTSNPIYYDAFLNADGWDEVSFNVESGVVVQLLYFNGSSYTLVPDAEIPDNSTGNTTSPIDISGLNTSTYNILRLRALNITSVSDVNEWRVKVDTEQGAPPTGINGIGNICVGATANLSVVGGTLLPGQDWGWFTGSCGGTLVGTGPTIGVNPSVTTTYYVGAISPNGCPVSACASGQVTLPSINNQLAENLDVATCIVNDNNFVHFFNPDGRLLLSINSQGQNLGEVEVQAFVNSAPLEVFACSAPTNMNLMTNVLQRHWIATPEFQPSTPVIIRLPLDDTPISGELSELINTANSNLNPNDDVIDIESLLLSKYHGPLNVDDNPNNNCFANGGNENTTIHSQLAYGNVTAMFSGFDPNARYVEYTISSFSELWLHGSENNSPLPVTLSDFDVECLGNTRIIHWATETETNADEFEIQVSKDAINWTSLAIEKAAGFSNARIEYQWKDRGTYPTSTIYYRLIQRDFDGAQEIYGPISATCETEEYTLFPNPASDRLQLTLPQQTNEVDRLVQIFTIDGKLVETFAIQGSNVSGMSLSISHLTPAIYLIQVSDSSGKKLWRERFVVIK